MIETPTMVEVPLRRDEDGRFRIGKTRVLLDLVIYAFHEGETAEGIVDSYPTLKLADVYAVISYYLNHREEIDEYIRQVEEDGARLQQEIEANYTPEMHALLNRLRAVKAEKRRSSS